MWYFRCLPQPHRTLDSVLTNASIGRTMWWAKALLREKQAMFFQELSREESEVCGLEENNWKATVMQAVLVVRLPANPSMDWCSDRWVMAELQTVGLILGTSSLGLSLLLVGLFSLAAMRWTASSTYPCEPEILEKTTSTIDQLKQVYFKNVLWIGHLLLSP